MGGVSDLADKIKTAYSFVVGMEVIDVLSFGFDNTDEKRYCFYRPYNDYSSPVTSEREYFYEEQRIQADDLSDIDLNITGQIELWNELKKYVPDFLNTDSVKKYSDNGWFYLTDSFIYYSTIRKLKPKRIVEVGSGYSTRVAIDSIKDSGSETIITCIEPYPQRLKGLLRDGNFENVNIIEEYVQEVPFEIFGKLEEKDILFIDSSHVSKVGGDIPYEFLNIIPRLKKGVMIHVHDIFYPFTYPKEWILSEGRPYNEAYILRAMLSNNDTYLIQWFSNMVNSFNDDNVKKELEELIGANSSGASVWIKKMK